jgi:alkyl hydroperoxide reductase subunit F
MYDLIIVGGGPAAITAGIYAGRKQINTLIITKDWGGQMQWTNRIENYPGFKETGGPELVDKMVNHLKSCAGDAVKVKEGVKAEKITEDKNGFRVKTDKEDFLSKAVIVATGNRPKKLGILGEEEFANKGVSYCPICDGPVFQNKETAVIGGGNAGLESALDLLNYSPKVYLLEFMSQLTGDEALVEEVRQNPKIEVLTNVEAKEIKGQDFVGGLVYKDKKTEKEKEIEVEGVFIEVGSIPNSDLVKDMLELNEHGEIKIDKNNRTSQKGVFASGDCSDIRYKQIVIAAGEGAKALLEASRYLSGD